MTGGRWLAAGLIVIALAAPAAARQDRSGGSIGRGGWSAGQQAAPRGAGGGTLRPAGSSVSRVSPRPTPPLKDTPAPRSAVTRVTPDAPPRTDRFSYPPPTRPPRSARDTRQRADPAPPVATDRRPSPAFRSGAATQYAVPRGSAERGYAGSGRAVPRQGSSHEAPLVYARTPRYVAPGWRSGSGAHVIVVPRHVRPRITGFAPYRRYCYRPSLGIGIVYGVGGFYPFGEVAPESYDPPPDDDLGGVRITDAPREAQVFVDGAYVGIVDDFDGPGQHLNLEAGLHRIEIHTPAAGAIAFDVTVRQGRTITLRAGAF